MLATARPSLAGTDTLEDRSRHGGEAALDEGGRDALELALLMADEDAAAGDFDRALQALEAAAAMAGGILPGEYAARRERWRARGGVPVG